MPQQQLTPELLAAVLSALLSLVTTYVPGFRTWFARKAEDVKMSLMGLATIVIAVVVYVLACTPSLQFTFVACPTGGIWGLLAMIIVALAANQGVDRISPEPADVQAAKAAQEAAKAADAMFAPAKQ